MKVFIETERTLLREILATDVEGMFELDSDINVHKYLGNNPATNREQVIENIRFIRQQYFDNGIGRWAIIDKETNDFMGWTGLKLVTESINDHVNYYDLGYRLIKRYWGYGIATETANASISYAFNNLNLPEVFAMADIKNISSNNILKKIGFNHVQAFNLKGTEHNWYRISGEEYKTGL